MNDILLIFGTIVVLTSFIAVIRDFIKSKIFKEKIREHKH